MQINHINNYTNTNFKGQIILRDVKTNSPEKSSINFMSVNSELIEQIIRRRPTTDRDYNPIITEDFMDKIVANDNQYKTIIKMASGDIYEVKSTPEDVIAAKKFVDGTTEITDLDSFKNSSIN